MSQIDLEYEHVCTGQQGAKLALKNLAMPADLPCASGATCIISMWLTIGLSFSTVCQQGAKMPLKIVTMPANMHCASGARTCGTAKAMLGAHPGCRRGTQLLSHTRNGTRIQAWIMPLTKHPSAAA